MHGANVLGSVRFADLNSTVMRYPLLAHRAVGLLRQTREF